MKFLNREALWVVLSGWETPGALLTFVLWDPFLEAVGLLVISLPNSLWD
jgi:hypothetical protein